MEITSTDVPHIDEPPIVEAIIEVRFTPSAHCSQSSIGKFSQKLKEQFPTQADRTKVTLEFKFPAKGENTQQEVVKRKEDLDGFLLVSSDGLDKLQIRSRSISLHRHAPYKSWNEFKALFNKLLAQYQNEIQPGFVQRIAVRYINKFDLPQNDFQKYFVSLPVRPDAWPSSISRYTGDYVMPDGDTEAHVKQAISPSKDGTAISVLFDIDAYATRNEAPNGESIGLMLDKLRHLKNRIFFGAITNATVEILKKKAH